MNQLNASLDLSPVVHSHSIIKRHATRTNWSVFKFRLLTVETREPSLPPTQERYHCAPSMTALPQHIGSERGVSLLGGSWMREVVWSAFQYNITGDLATGTEGFLRFTIKLCLHAPGIP